MYSVLIKFGPITIYSYGTLIAIGFLIGIFLARYRADKYGLNPDRILDLGLYTLIGGLIGARITYVLVNLKSYMYRPVFDIFKIWEGGLVYYGGLIVGVLVGLWYIKKIKYNFWKTVDVLAPSIAIGQVFGRIGCFLNGCCYGKVSNKFGLVFNSLNDNLSHIPTQLIESIFTFIIFLFLLKRDKKKKFEGEIFLLYLLLYSSGRFIIETIRGDDRGAFFFGIISISQFVSILIFLISAKGLLKNAVKSR